MGYIIGSNVRLRKKPSAKAPTLALLNKNEKISILEVMLSNYLLINHYYGKWSKVRYKDKLGYIFTAFISNDKEFSEEKFHIFYRKFVKLYKNRLVSNKVDDLNKLV